MFGHVYYSGHAITDAQQLAGFFPEADITSQKDWIDKKREDQLAVPLRLHQASFPSSWPENIVNYDNNLPVITYNCGNATPERLEQILRYYKGYAVIVLLGTCRGLRTAPRG